MGPIAPIVCTCLLKIASTWVNHTYLSSIILYTLCTQYRHTTNQLDTIILLRYLYCFVWLYYVRILAAPDKNKPPLCAITPVTRLTNTLTWLTNLERLYNSRSRLPAAAAAMVRLANRISKTTCTQLS